MSKKKGMQWYDFVFIILLIAGGLNWGLVAFFEFDLVQFLVGTGVLDTIVKGAVFVSAVYSALWLGFRAK